MNINDLPTITLTSKMKDYSGETRGQFIILKPAEIKNKKTYWWAQCTCGTIEKIRIDQKRIACLECSKKLKSQHLKGKKIKDLTNQKFGKLTVLYLIKQRTKDGNAIWHCKCECGNECDICSKNLVQNITQSCGCLRKENAKKMGKNTFHDLTNQRFGSLIAISKTNKKQNSNYIWKCNCDCGNIHYVAGGQLVSGKIKSCGCKRIEAISQAKTINIINQRIGKLIVLKQAGKDSDGSYNYLCQCDCGNQKIINGVSLRRGVTKSCGCINYSIGEKNIQKILQDNDIKFQQEYIFSDLPKKRYDFVIIENNQISRIIEFDGRQHFEVCNNIWEKSSSLKERQQRDKEKNEYALSHNIPLVRIPYWERDNITLEMLMSDKYLVREAN